MLCVLVLCGSSMGLPFKSSLLLKILCSICKCCSPVVSIASIDKTARYRNKTDCIVSFLIQRYLQFLLTVARYRGDYYVQIDSQFGTSGRIYKQFFTHARCKVIVHFWQEQYTHDDCTNNRNWKDIRSRHSLWLSNRLICVKIQFIDPSNSLYECKQWSKNARYRV